MAPFWGCRRCSPARRPGRARPAPCSQGRPRRSARVGHRIGSSTRATAHVATVGRRAQMPAPRPGQRTPRPGRRPAPSPPVTRTLLPSSSNAMAAPPWRRLGQHSLRGPGLTAPPASERPGPPFSRCYATVAIPPVDRDDGAGRQGPAGDAKKMAVPAMSPGRPIRRAARGGDLVADASRVAAIILDSKGPGGDGVDRDGSGASPWPGAGSAVDGGLANRLRVGLEGAQQLHGPSIDPMLITRAGSSRSRHRAATAKRSW